MAILIADSGSTKCEWVLAGHRPGKSYFTQGLSPYFLTSDQMEKILKTELFPQMKFRSPSHVHFYGTGCVSKENSRMIRKMLGGVFSGARVTVDSDVLGAARALCQQDPGIACILGTGSNSCYYNGKRIVKNSPGTGYVLGDEGSGAYLGKKVIQYFLYETFDKTLKRKFEQRFRTTADDIFSNVYHKPLPNRYLASFSKFLSENRGHYMIENIIEDGLNDFFHTHLTRYKETSKYPIHFTGSVAFHFRDVIKNLCDTYGFRAGTILQAPMKGLIRYHKH